MSGGLPDAAAPVRIEAVVFDVGHVLVETDYDPWLRLLAAHGAPFESMDAFCEAVDLDAHEAGAVDGETFLRRVERLLRRPVERAQLVREWNAMYSPVVPLLAAARRLKVARRVYLLSNMGEVHWAHLERLLDVAGGTDGALPSYRVGRLKPTPEIYAAAEAAFRLQPSRTVFVDDRADNVAAARARGWHAVQHVAVEPTLDALARFGLPVHDSAAGA